MVETNKLYSANHNVPALQYSILRPQAVLLSHKHSPAVPVCFGLRVSVRLAVPDLQTLLQHGMFLVSLVALYALCPLCLCMVLVFDVLEDVQINVYKEGSKGHVVQGESASLHSFFVRMLHLTSLW